MSDLERISFPPRKLPEGTTRKVLKASILPLLFGGIWLTVGAGLAVFFSCIGNPLHDYWLSRNGRIAEGTVTEVTVKRNVRMAGKHPWVIRYRFQASGRDWSGKSFTVKKAAVRGLKAGSNIEVEYLAEKAVVNRAKDTRASMFPAAAFLAPGFFVVVGGVVLLCGLGKVARLRTLLVNGHVALATVTGQKRKRYGSVGRRRPLDVSYEFQDSRGMDCLGRTRVYSPRPGLGVAAGQELSIVYDSLNPRTNFAYELYDIDFSKRA